MLLQIHTVENNILAVDTLCCVNRVLLFVGCLHISDHSDTVPEMIHRSADSDNEEFCDSMEHLAMEEVCT